MFRLENISKQYNEEVVLKNINFNIEQNGIYSIVGPSGSGKTTLLRILGLLIKPTDGKIIFNNEDVTNLKLDQTANYRREDISFILQNFGLLDELTVKENIYLIKNFMKIDNIDKEIEKYFKIANLDLDILKKYPHQISGGQKQRVAIVRALIKKSKIILADEPTGNLDKNNTNSIFDVLKKISKDKIVIIITHDNEIAKKTDKIFELEEGVLNEKAN